MVLLLTVTLFSVPGASAFTPPPAEFSDAEFRFDTDLFVHRFDDSFGPATSTLDLIPSTGAAVGDYNGDGWDDLYVPMTAYTDDALTEARAPGGKLYLNSGSEKVDNYHLVDVTDVAGVDVVGFAFAGAWADVDNDGDLDLFSSGYHLLRALNNNGDGTFTDATATLALPQTGFTMGMAFGDYDGDGDLDLALAELAEYDYPADGLVPLDGLVGSGNRLLRNDAGTFVDVSASAGLDTVSRRSTSIAWVDFDNDNDLDLYITNYGQPAEAWRNDGATFTEVAASIGLSDGARATCQSWEDLDHDGLLDLYVGHEAGVHDGVWLGAGSSYTDISGTLGLAPLAAGDTWGCRLLDYDNDSDFDIVAIHMDRTTGSPQSATLLMNRWEEGAHTLSFLDQTAEAGDGDVPGFTTHLDDPLAAAGLALMDWDNEGSQDLIVTPNEPGRMHMFQNYGYAAWAGTGDWVDVTLAPTVSAGSGEGAKVRLVAGDIDVTRQLGSAMSWGASATEAFRFGVHRQDSPTGFPGYAGEAYPVSVTITWPSGIVDHHANIVQAPPMAVRFIEGGGYLLDSVAPKVSFSNVAGVLGQNGWYTSEDVTMRLTASDKFVLGSARSGVDSLRYSHDGINWTSVAKASSGALITFSGEGVHPLWIEAMDNAGNAVRSVYPVRIDTTAPGAVITEPAVGVVYVQGRAAMIVPDLDRAIIVAPHPADLAAMPAVDELAGTDGWMTVRLNPFDAASGVGSASYRIVQTNGRVPDGMSGSAEMGPYSWDWPAHRAGPGEFRIIVDLVDRAGHTGQVLHKLEIVPTTPEGLSAQPSNPTPG